MKRGLIVIVIIAVVIVVVFGYLKYSQKSEEKKIEELIPVKQPSLKSNSQSLVNNKIIIEGLYFDKPGFVVIYRDENRKPGEVIGHSSLLSEERNNLSVEVNLTKLTENIFIILHYDDNDNEKYDFPIEDNPIILNNKTIVSSIIIKNIKEIQKPKIIGPPSSFSDSFDSQKINTEIYTTRITGDGSIKQNDKIIMTGNAENEILWNILYTNKNIDFTKDFSIVVKIDLKGSSQGSSDIMTIIGVEDRSQILKGTEPKGAICEISSGFLGKILRMQSTTSAHSINYQSISTTSGVINMKYDSKTSTLTCIFDNKEMTTYQPSQQGDFAIVLRSGLHKISHEGSESTGSGSFETIYDDLQFKA